MSNKTVAALLIETLALAGVRRIYGVAGDSLNAITEVIRTNKDISWSPVRNEEAAAFAAGAEAQITGTLAVCAGSCGPGNLHLINGLYEAQRSRVPVLAIAAQIPSAELGSNFFQETHPEIIFRECSHYTQLVSQPDQLPWALEVAMQTAISLRGVATLVIPGDIASKPAPPDEPRRRFSLPHPVTRPADDELDRMAAMLNGAANITILGGAGCEGAHDELVAVAEKLKSPVVHALRGKEFVEPNNPYDVGLTGLLGFSSGYHALMHADVVLMLGTDFPYRAFYPEKAKIIQVDIRGEQLGRRTKVDLGLVGNVKATLSQLLPKLTGNTDSSHLNRFLHHYKETRKGLNELATGTPGSKPIHPQYLATVLNEVASEDAIFTCDVGTPTLWAARYLAMNGKRRLLGSFSHGSMANALVQAIGAQSAAPGRQVISMSGDGGLAMLMGEILSLRQLKLPVKIVLFQNNALSFVELEMKAAGQLDYGTELVNPNFKQIAEAAGLLGLRAETPEQVRPMLEQAFAYDGPALVEVMVNRQELSMPPSISIAQAKGFSLYMMRAVMNGRGDEVLDLANTNLLREIVSVAKGTLLP